jgi:coproporphyrinogen III oxidase-like Fe-S oxidoreductase
MSQLRYDAFSVVAVNALPRFPAVGERETIDTSTALPYGPKIGLYVHIPVCLSICPFCMLRKGARASPQVEDSIFSAILREIELIGERVAQKVSVDSIYVGGGTPSVLSEKQILELFALCARVFECDENVEITFEAEARSLLDRSKVMALADCGVRRVSYGVQTFDESLRRLLGREDSVSDLFRLRELLTRAEITDVNVDYMYNLPSTTPSTVEQDLQLLDELAPTSVDCHPLKYTSCAHTVLSAIVDRRLSIPSSAERVATFNLIQQWMIERGYRAQFSDQYRKSELGMENNVYMQRLYGLRGGEYIGVGPGARSHFGDVGYTTAEDFHRYVRSVAENRVPVVRTVRAPMHDNYITCFPKRGDSLTDKAVAASRYSAYYRVRLMEFAKAGLIRRTHNRYVLTEAGLPWYQNLQEELLSPAQRRNHMQGASARAEKLLRYGDYFNPVGRILRNGLVG